MTDSQRLEISGHNFQQLITSVVEKDALVTFKVTGKSMFPNIINGDRLTLAPYQGQEPEVGDVVALANLSKNTISVHRIIKKKAELFLIKGDNVFKSDGVFSQKSIIGYICEIKRGKKKININKLKNKRIVFLSKIRFFCLSKPLFLFNLIK